MFKKYKELKEKINFLESEASLTRMRIKNLEDFQTYVEKELRPLQVKLKKTKKSFGKMSINEFLKFIK